MASGFKTASVQSGKVSGTSHSDFPVYVDLDRLGITTLAEAESVRVYADSAKTTEWAREIVSLTEMHVKVPSLTSTVDIYVDWDGVRSDYGVTTTYGRNNVWSDYVVVFHKQTNTSSLAVNSTGGTNGNLSFTDGAVTFPSVSTSGKLASGYDYGTSTNKRGVNTQYTLDLSTSALYEASRMTFQVWAYPTASHNSYFISNDTAVGFGVAYITNKFRWAVAPSDINEPGTSATNTWHMLHLVKDTDTNVFGYKNGSLQNTMTRSGASGPASAGVLGLTHRNPAIVPFAGIMDEYRLRLAALNANWITTDYNNQNAESTFWGTWTDAVSTSIKSLNGLAIASVKSRNGLALASIKSINGLSNTS